MEMVDALARYGNRSMEGLERGGREVRDMVHALLAKVPEPIDRAAGIAAEYMPGAGLRQGLRDGREARSEWDRGNYPAALRKHADAVDHGSDFLWWLMPGGGLVPK